MARVAASLLSPISHPVSCLGELTSPFHENVREKNTLSSRGRSLSARNSSVLTFIDLPMMGCHGAKEARDMTTFHDAKDAQKYRARLRRQRDYQRKYRERLIGEGAPERSDIAAASLQAFLMILVTDAKSMGRLPRMLFDVLEKRGFDRKTSIDVVDKMAHRMVRRARR